MRLFSRSQSRIPKPFWLRISFFGCVLLLIAALTLPWNGFTLLVWWKEAHSGIVLSQARTTEKVVALTFDDGPDPQTTPHILTILKQYHVRATFFQQARMVYADPSLAKQVLAQGHVIGNHTVTHPYLERKSPKEVQLEIVGCDACFESQLGIRSHLFRPPRGAWNPTIYRAVQRDHDHLILWSVALEHHDAPTPQAMAERVLHLIRPGGIILMHDGARVSRETTVQALPLLLNGLKRQGYRCVTVPELLHIPGDEPVHVSSESVP